MSFRTKVIAGITALVALTLSAMLALDFYVHRAHLREVLTIQASELARTSAAAIIPAVERGERELVGEQLNALVAEEGVIFVRVFAGAALLAEAGPTRSDAEMVEVGNGTARVQVGYSPRRLDEHRARMDGESLLLGFLVLALGGVLALAFYNFIGRDLKLLQQASRRIARGELGFELATPGGGRDELAHVIEAFNEMSRSLAHARALSAERERALRQSEASLSQAQRIARLGGWEWNCLSGQLHWSDEVYEIFGNLPASFRATYEAFLERVHPEDRAMVEAAVAAARERGLPYDVVHRVVRADTGEERLVRERGEVELGEGGQLVRMVGTVQDVTESERAEQELRAQRFWLETLVDAMPAFVCLKDGGGRWLVANRWVVERLNLRREEYEGRMDTELAELRPDLCEYLLDAMDRDEAAWSAGSLVVQEEEVPLGGGTRPVEMTRVPLFKADGSRKGLVLVGRDLTEHRETERNLWLASQVFESSIEGILVTDAQGHVVRVNQAFSDITGYSHSDIIGQNPSLLKSGCHDEMFYQNLWRELLQTGKWEGEIWNRRKSGEIFPEWLAINVLRDGAGLITNYVAVFTDLSEKKAAEQRIEQLAYYDALTDLPNRSMLMGRLEQAIVQAQRSKRLVALLYIDLDRFKNINDTLGHPVGDRLLRLSAERLAAATREYDMVARLGGDEFVIMLTELDSERRAGQVAEQVLKEMAEPFELDGHEIFVTSSIGVALWPVDAPDKDELIRNADTAMHHAKEDGRNAIQFYRREMNATALERLVMESSLRRALERSEFMLLYQPQVCIESGIVVGVEALIRWRHPELGLVSPAQFVPMLEETGLMVSVGAWVLRTACAQQVAWCRAGLPPLRMAVNISPQQLDLGVFVHNVSQIIQETGIRPEMLEFELTEGSLMKSPEASALFMAELKAMGIRLSVDDFGTGYSSLGYLKRFPVDTLKIDQSFIRDVTIDPDDAAIASTVIAMGHSLGHRVIAEGVETEAQLAFLRRHGCDEIQGYLFSRPLPATELSELLQEGRGLDPSNPFPASSV